MLYHPPTLQSARVTYLDGNAGIFQTAQIMRQIVDQYKTNVDIRSLALSIVDFLPGKDEAGEIAAIFAYVRDKIRYVKDVAGVETLATPDVTLHFGQGDCDDQSVLLAALLESIGYQTGFKLVSYGGPTFEHVYVLVHLRGNWFPADPTEAIELGSEIAGYVKSATVF